MKKRLVCFGTSLTSSGGWVKMLKKHLPDWRVIQSGKGGMNSNWGMDNFQKKVLKYNPHVVLMEFAVNDCYIGEPYYEKPSYVRGLCNINFMIKQLKWCKVFYMTMNQPLDMYLSGRNPKEDRPIWWTTYRMHRKVANSAGAEIINITDKWEVLDNETFLEYCPDGLHPNELGSKMITIPAIIEALND